MNARRRTLAALAGALFCASGYRAAAQTAQTSSDLRFVAIVTRHGVRSPTDPHELDAYSAHPWPAWQTAPGFLTPHGATLMTTFGAWYRRLYASEGLLPADGCPPPGAVYVYADVDQRTTATGTALLAGIAPNCGLAPHVVDTKGGAKDDADPFFHAIPAFGKADPALAKAAVEGTLGAAPQAVMPAYGLAFARLDAILGCAPGKCTRVEDVPPVVTTNPKTGLASVEGGLDVAATAVENMLLAYADGFPVDQVGWGAADRKTLLELSQLHALKYVFDVNNGYAARVLGSNIIAHVRASLDQGATGTHNDATRVPPEARLAIFVGHDTNLAAIGGALHLHWLMPGYTLDDTPPGGALVFEVHRASTAAKPYVRIFFTAQSLDQMRALAATAPARVPVYLPGCPALDCPLDTFDRIVDTSIEPAFVGHW